MLDAILPLVAGDLPRFTLLRELLARHGSDIATCWIVAPDADVAAVEAAVAGESGYRVVPETELLGRPAPKSVGRIYHRGRPGAGWYIQQVLKLAGTARLDASYCLTLDADLIPLRAITEEAIAPGGRAWIQTNAAEDHPDWYRGSARLLRMPRATRSYSVTPAALSPSACREMIGHLSTRARGGDWIGMLLSRPVWTEYSLYGTYLEATGRLERYHVVTAEPTYYAEKQVVWHADGFESWRPQEGPLFTLVQSATGIPIEEIRARLAA